MKLLEDDKVSCKATWKPLHNVVAELWDVYVDQGIPATGQDRDPAYGGGHLLTLKEWKNGMARRCVYVCIIHLQCNTIQLWGGVAQW